MDHWGFTFRSNAASREDAENYGDSHVRSAISENPTPLLAPDDAAAHDMDRLFLNEPPFGNDPPQDALDVFEPTPIREHSKPCAPILETSRFASVLESALIGMERPHPNVTDASDLCNIFDDDDDHQTNNAFPQGTAPDISRMFAKAVDSAIAGEANSSSSSIRKIASCTQISQSADASVPKRRRISNDDTDQPSFKRYQEAQWMKQFRELVKFKDQNGHCLVPHDYLESKVLSRWVKRQRYQYKLKMTGKANSMTDSRVRKLQDIGFVWNSHTTTWDKRLEELKQYRDEHGDCDVPMNHPENPALATWIKVQRRQYKLFWSQDKASSMTLDRIKILDEIGFIWNVHKHDVSVTSILEQ